MSARNVSAVRPHVGIGVMVTGTVSGARTWNLIFRTLTPKSVQVAS
ncbi:MAG TPA: hypothetical protein VH352_11820 [Pseudonocardiaceae bacterium]|jgi:hypothetical protein|nr:hypothetical protein [Pseudonocardiaceae bacterium]